MTDPFLPEQGLDQAEGNDPLAPEDVDLDEKGSDELTGESSGEESADAGGVPPVDTTVFKTPTGDSVDPARDL